MKVNWKVRVRNKNFWISIIPAILLLLQYIGKMFGLEFDINEILNNLINVVNLVFMVLAILGIVTDPTTTGLSDSNLAMEYEIPKTKEGYTKISDIATMNLNPRKQKPKG